jgi:hypothetical protein
MKFTRDELDRLITRAGELADKGIKDLRLIASVSVEKPSSRELKIEFAGLSRIELTKIILDEEFDGVHYDWDDDG